MSRGRRIGRALRVLALGVAAGAAPRMGLAQAPAQLADSLVHVGDVAARDSRHQEAIAAYGRAIEVDPARRAALLPKLGRQRLWAGDARSAASLLSEHLAADPGSCETRLDLALAWSWADELTRARRAYDETAARCPALRAQALLGAARVLRWGNRLAAADAAYREVLRTGSAEDRLQAAVGLSFVHLADGAPRRALALLDSLAAAGMRDPALAEARAMALADLGERAMAVSTAQRAQADGLGSDALTRLAREYQASARPSFRAGAQGFSDRDGTAYQAVHLGGGVAPLAFGTLRVEGRATALRAGGVTIRSHEVDGAIDARPARALALAARGGIRDYDPLGFSPWEGELDLVWLPGDRHRVDLSAARILIGDNPAALQAHLAGSFGSVGVTERLGRHLWLVLAGDATRWSEGNVRLRARAMPQLRLAGVPAVSLEWPTTYQHYDEPFAFSFFSPTDYVETGPALSVARRVARAWQLSLYARGGALRETGGDWQPLGAVSGAIERELRGAWGLRADGSWSNSNIAGSTGFQRSRVGLSVFARP